MRGVGFSPGSSSPASRVMINGPAACTSEAGAASIRCSASGISVFGSTPDRVPSTSAATATWRVTPPSAPRIHRKTKTTIAASTPRSPAMAKGDRKAER